MAADTPPGSAASIPYEGTDCTAEEAVEAVRAVRASAVSPTPRRSTSAMSATPTVTTTARGPDANVGVTVTDDPTAACEWCGRAVKRNDEGRWYAVKGAERGYDPLTCEASEDCRHSPDQPTAAAPAFAAAVCRWHHAHNGQPVPCVQADREAAALTGLLEHAGYRLTANA